MKSLLLWMLNGYKKYISNFITQLFGNRCLYTPTCSEYAIDAIQTYPLPKALWLSFVRVLSCNPINGYFMRKKLRS